MSQNTANSSQQPSQSPLQTLPPPQWQQPPSQPQQPYQPPQYVQQQPQPQVQPPMQHVPKPKKSRRNLWIVIGAVIVLIIIIASATHGQNSTAPTTQATPAPTQQSQPTITPQPTQVPTPEPTAKPAPTFPQFGDGTYQVGKDIQPGTYRTLTGSSGCYYARLKGFGGTVGEIIANNITDAPAIVSIASSDMGFESQSCGTWTQDLSQITTSNTTIGDGMYVIGTDIAPGTYRNTGASGCYYARLSGFGNTTDDIIANNIVDTATIVTIASSDKGFQSNGCGTWTKQ